MIGLSFGLRKLAGVSKIETDAKLQLSWVRSRSKAERFGWRCRAVAPCADSGQSPSLIGRQTANHVINTRKVRPIEDVKCFKGQLEKHGFFEGKAPGNARVETIKRLADTRVTTNVKGTIGLRATIVIGVEAKQQIERATRPGREDGREDPIRQQLFTKRVSFDTAGKHTAKNGAMSLVKARECAIEP